MEWGASRVALEAAREDGKKTPLDDRPELNQWTVFYWAAFADLSTCRSIGMGVGPIPWSAAANYAAQQGITDPDDFAVFWEVIGAMDSAYLEHAAKKKKEKER